MLDALGGASLSSIVRLHECVPSTFAFVNLAPQGPGSLMGAWGTCSVGRFASSLLVGARPGLVTGARRGSLCCHRGRLYTRLHLGAKSDGRFGRARRFILW